LKEKKKKKTKYNYVLLESLVTIHQGTMRGIVEDDVRVFLGVPFAQPPINE